MTFKMSFQFVSDLHIEFLDDDLDLNPVANYLILAGDIGVVKRDGYRSFLERHSKLYKHIFLVSGNHEYYDMNISDAEDKIREICSKLSNVTYLQCDNVKFSDKYSIIGCTLWSDVHYSFYNNYKFMGDYKYIKNNNRKFKIEDSVSIHRKHLAYIEEQLKINKENGLKTIIITHHAPSEKMNLHDGLNSSFYVTDLEYLMEKYNIEYWISGHTHDCVTRKIYNTCCMSNCMGYYDEPSEGFDPDKTFVV